MKCLDTYALVEISRGNINFLGYLKKECTIPDLLLAEFYFVTLREFNEKTANYWLNLLRIYTTTVNLDILIKAVKYRHDNKQQNLSFFDCVGYIFARENRMKFVTGDKEFENKAGVEFIKGIERNNESLKKDNA